MKKSCLLACALAACNGTETGNPPVIDFGNSGCRTKLYEDNSKGIYPQSLVDDPLYEGLTCITFEHATAVDYRFQITNYESGCGADEGWAPVVELRDDGGVDLILEDSDCATASCLWCVYDLSFTVKFDHPPADGTVHFYQRGCSDEQRRPKSAFLPLSTLASGAACNYQHSVALFERNRDVGGPRTMCAPMEGFDPPQCRAGLRCTDLGARAPGDFSGGQRCLATCESDADCDALSRCDGGVCKLSASGLSSR